MMKATYTIFKKELAGFFKSPLFYFLSFTMTILLSILFSISLEKFAQASGNAVMQFGASAQMLNIHYAVFLPHLSIMNLIFIFLIPALCMKLLSEEKKMRTFDLLLTSPVSSASIVLGKYFAALVTVLALILVSFVYPAVSRRVFEFSWAPTIVAALGIFLVAAVYTAMSMFASSLTENGLVAFVLSIVLNLSVWFIGALNESFDGSTLKAVLEHLSLNTHLAAMIEGTIRTNGLIFFLSLIFLFCFLTERVVESARWRA
ncbi:ABC transporter permease subunit [Pseudobdellovibrio exovorus]|uniref:ABC-type transport system permease protein n=1 Tax=Pseudobdellovibrio exovorus JSS TaxID=1184267 RepID=M4VAJ9_9BACT|nr:ABC transporter permease subunit [Pseudobdellovibrio exovorus]AGH95036.1 ABC-type transport system permease protein [Pseudobdellovibrio exovorus JSS]